MLEKRRRVLVGSAKRGIKAFAGWTGAAAFRREQRSLMALWFRIL